MTITTTTRSTAGAAPEALATLPGYLGWTDALDEVMRLPASLWAACAWCWSFHPHPAAGVRPGAVVERRARCSGQYDRGRLAAPRSDSPHVAAGGYRIAVMPGRMTRSWANDSTATSWRISTHYRWPEGLQPTDLAERLDK